MYVLLLNAGSSSLKATLVDSAQDRVLASSLAEWAGPTTNYSFVGPMGLERSEQVSWKGHADAVHRLVEDLLTSAPAVLNDREQLSAVGHRVVHGGPFTQPVRITPEIRARLRGLADLAPLHNPPSLETLAAAESELPDVPQIAVFDTAFHATLTPAAYTYPVPATWTNEWGLRRYGFHGLSHAYCARRASEMMPQPATDLRVVICHLGHGCSASAVRGERCVDTTMGFTPLEGLMMATRSGSIDPGLLLHVQKHRGLSAQQVETALNRQSGLLGVSGESADMRAVIAAAKEGNQRAELALEIYCRRVRQAIGALTVTLGGIDALVFTAGVGEHSAIIRQRVCTGLGCLGLILHSEANDSCRTDADIATAESPARILVIAAREDVTMLREINRLLTDEDAS